MINTESISAKRNIGLKIDYEKLLVVIAGFLLSRVDILDGFTPFGLAFLGSFLIMKNKSMTLLLSIVLGVFTLKGLKGIDYYLILGISYLVFTKIEGVKRFSLLKSSGLLSLIFLLIKMGSLFFINELFIYDIFLIGFESVLVFSMTYVFSFSFPIGDIRNTNMHGEKLICSFITLGLIISGVGSLQIFSISLKNIISIILLIYLSYKHGVIVGASSGVIIGLMAYISQTEMPFIIAILGLSGLFAGVFKDLGKSGSILGFILGNGIISYYINNLGTSFLNYREILISSLGFLILSSLVKIDLGELFTENSKIKRDYYERKNKMVLDSLDHTVELFNSLSDTFKRSFQNKDIYPKTQVYDLINEVSNKTCKNCTSYNKCWKEEYHTRYNDILNMIALVEGNMQDSQGLEIIAGEFCINEKSLIDHIRDEYKIFKINRNWNLKLIEQRQLLSEQLKGVGLVINNISKEIYKEPVFKEELEEELIKELKNMRINIEDLSAAQIGKDDLEVLIILKEDISSMEEVEDIRSILSENIGCNMTCNYTYGNVISKDRRLKFNKAKKFSTLTKVASIANTENGISGDNLSYGEVNTTSYMAISDGMGTGNLANKESGIAIELLEKLVETDLDRDIIIKTLNSVLRTKSNEELFTTLDLGFIDLYTGKCQILKTGSPATFIKKKDRVVLVDSTSLPIGILENVDFNIYEEYLDDGDIVIMMSDGILDSNREVERGELWMKELIEKMSIQSPEIMAKEILDLGKLMSGEEIRDDMTVVVTKVLKRI